MKTHAIKLSQSRKQKQKLELTENAKSHICFLKTLLFLASLSDTTIHLSRTKKGEEELAGRVSPQDLFDNKSKEELEEKR